MLYKLRDLRKEQGLNQTELGRLVGKKQRMISKYENEEVEMPVSVAKKIGKVLEINWWELYEE